MVWLHTIFRILKFYIVCKILGRHDGRQFERSPDHYPVETCAQHVSLQHLVYRFVMKQASLLFDLVIFSL